MKNEVIKAIQSSDGARKIEMFKRGNGTFGFEDLKYGKEEESWFPVGGYSTGIFETKEDALKEAKSRISWLATIKSATI